MLLFFTFRFECLISGPKSYRDFRETGPRAVNRINTVDVIDEIKSRIWEIKEGKSLYKERRQDSGRCNFSYARYLEKCFT